MPTSLFIFIATVFGLVVGSFLNVVIHRLPKILEREWEFELASHIAEKSGAEPPSEPTPYTLSAPRSACPCCGTQLSALENIPLVSYVALGGKCAFCKMDHLVSTHFP